MNNENNNFQIDIDNLFKQNVNDLSAIKELYRKLQEMENKILQIKYIDSNLANKLKKEYEKLKRIILADNVQAKLSNDIETINLQLDTKASKEETKNIQVKLSNDIKKINSHLDTKASKIDLEVERKRIDKLTKLGEGSTTGDAELIDARIGANGVVYDNLGTGLRKQFNVINNDINNIKSLSEYIYLENGYITGKYVSPSTGNFVNKSEWTTTEFIDIESIDKYLYMNVSRANYHYLAFYDENKNYISGGTSNNAIYEWAIEIPYNAKYIRASFYTDDKDTFYLKGKTKFYNSVGQSEELTVATENFNSDDFEYGTIDTNTGVTASSETRLRYYGYLSNTILKIQSNLGYEFMIYGYQNGSYIGTWNDRNKKFNVSATWIKFADLQQARKLYPNLNVKLIMKKSNENITIDEAINLIKTKERYSTIENYINDNKKTANVVYYIDGVNGSDTNKGTDKSPLKSFKKALELGGNILYAKGGIYKESIQIVDKDKVKIIPWGWLYLGAEEGLVERKKIILDSSEDINLTESTDYTGLLECGYIANEDSYLYKVFIDKSLPIINTENVTTHGDAYNCTLWECYNSNTKGDFRLLPVLTLDECKTTKGSYYYDGSKIYVNPKDTSSEREYKLSGDNYYGVEIQGCREVVLEDIVSRFARGANFYLKNIDSAIIRGCEGRNASIRNGFRMMSINGEFYNCIGNNNKADGIALQVFGCVNFFNCEASFNGDDGLSPHDGCFGSVSNSIFSNNTKGGVSAVNGASYNLFNVISHNNEFGFLMTSTEGCKRRNIRIMNCVAYDNGTGICTSRNDFLVYNGKFVRNTLNKQIINTSTFVELDNITD